MSNTKQKPVDSHDLYPIEASIWANPGQDGKVFYTVTIARRFKQGETYKTTSSFSARDLDKLEAATVWARRRLGELSKEAVLWKNSMNSPAIP